MTWRLLVKYALGLTLILGKGIAVGQSSRKLVYSMEIGGYYSTNNKIPFWLRSNQFGAIPGVSNTLLFRQNLYSKPDTSKKRFIPSYGFDMAIVTGGQAKVVIPEAYYNLKYKKWNLLLGRKKQVHGFMDSTLSSGSITWSGNSLPIPEVQIGIPEYTKFLSKRIYIKGHFSHGWFGNQTTVKRYYLHQKSLYVRFGKPESKIKLYGGMLHHAQWGGIPKYEIPEWDNRFKNGRFPNDLYTYLNILVPVSRPVQDTSYANYDIENRFGNHLGQIDMGGEINLEKYKWLIYKQLIFETGQTFSSLTNLDDGLYGVSLQNKDPDAGINRVVLEFLHTTNQGIYRAGLLRLIGFYGKHFGKNQNFYFNHGQYLDGWSYNTLTIGSPFMIPNPEIRNEKSSNEVQLFANNNRLKVGYLGIQSKINSVSLETRLSVSRNFGSPKNEFGYADQMSFGIKAQIPAPYWSGTINLGVGIEQGDLIYDNYGFFASFKKVWK